MAVTNFSQQSRTEFIQKNGISPRAVYRESTSQVWNLIWEAGPYYERVAAALEQAHSYAIFVGWQIDSRIELSTKQHEAFKQLIVRLCQQKPDFHVYFLMWDYAYFYAFEREALQGWVWENVHERVHFVFDNRHPFGASHHEKFVVIDGEVAFVGGVDICDDRWDTPHHYFSDSRRSLKHDREEHRPYHDMSVEVRGEIAADLVTYIGERWRALTTIPFPERPRVALSEGRGSHRVLISRTKSSIDARRPLLIRETEFLFRDLIRSAERQLVIENQYYWSAKINEELIALMHARVNSGFRIFIVVPPGYGGSTAFRMMGVVQSRLFERLISIAEKTGTRLVLGCPFVYNRDGTLERPVYVHSKMLIIDDKYMAIGSSNFNNRGFRVDTEITLTFVGDTDESRAEIRKRTEGVISHWGSKIYSEFFRKPAPRPAAENHIHLKPYFESWRDYLGSGGAWIARHIPIERVFDPDIPLNYFFKWRLALLSNSRLGRIISMAVWIVFLLTLAFSLFALNAVTQMLGQGDGAEMMTTAAITPRVWWIVLYAFFLSSSWLLPVPVFLVSIFAGIQFGEALGPLIVASALVASASAGYFFSRVFPSLSMEYFGNPPPEWLAGSIGLRSLPVLIRSMFSPKGGFQMKVAYQGIFSIPVRWFASSMIALTGMYVVFAYSAGLVASSESLAPYRMDHSQGFFWFSLVLILFLAIARLAKQHLLFNANKRELKNQNA